MSDSPPDQLNQNLPRRSQASALLPAPQRLPCAAQTGNQIWFSHTAAVSLCFLFSQNTCIAYPTLLKYLMMYQNGIQGTDCRDNGISFLIIIVCSEGRKVLPFYSVLLAPACYGIMKESGCAPCKNNLIHQFHH